MVGIDLGGEDVASSDKWQDRSAPAEENLVLRWTHRILECWFKRNRQENCLQNVSQEFRRAPHQGSGMGPA